MLTHFLTEQDICSFNEYLLREERSRGTVEKYLRDVRAFRRWVQETPVTKETIIAWKEHLLGLNYAATTINSMLSSLHGLLDFLGWHECRVQFLKIQRKLFRAPERELTKGEFVRLVTTARNFGRELPALVIETICATGIRVSEVCHITVEATATGRTEIMLKGKIRTIFLPGKLCRKLQKYAPKNNIASGPIFRSRTGACLSRQRIWSIMKQIGRAAGVPLSKVFPHNLRHIFATLFYHASKDIVQLADVLGHSSINTTRIYLMSSGREHARRVDQLGLIL